MYINNSNYFCLLEIPIMRFNKKVVYFVDIIQPLLSVFYESYKPAAVIVGVDT